MCISMVIFKILYSELFAGGRAMRRLSPFGGSFISKDVKIFQSAFHRFCHIADEGDHSLPTAHRKAL